MKKENTPSNPYAGRRWIIYGLIWGVFVFIIMSFLFPLIEGKELIMSNIFLIEFPIWLIAGVIFGFILKLIYREKKKKTGAEKDNESIDS